MFQDLDAASSVFTIQVKAASRREPAAKEATDGSGCMG
jgi:hypothetical protein